MSAPRRVPIPARVMIGHHRFAPLRVSTRYEVVNDREVIRVDYPGGTRAVPLEEGQTSNLDRSRAAVAAVFAHLPEVNVDHRPDSVTGFRFDVWQSSQAD